MVYSIPNINDSPFNGRIKGSKKPWTQEQLDFIYCLIYEQHIPKKVIAEKYNISSDSIRRRIKENDWLAKKNLSMITDKDIQEMRREYENGKSLDEISTQFSISKESIIRIKDRGWVRSKPRKTKYTVNENYFDIIDDEHKAYWLGFFYADGYILHRAARREYSREQRSCGFSISINDVEIAENFKKDIQFTGPIKIYERSNNEFSGSKTCRILITSEHLCTALEKLGCGEQKTFILVFPSEEQVPKHLQPAFIRGYLDGDGSISFYELENKCNLHFCGTKELLNGIQEFFGTDVKLSQRFPKRLNNNYDLKYCGNRQIEKFLNKIYENATIYLTRKYDKYLQLIEINENH